MGLTVTRVRMLIPLPVPSGCCSAVVAWIVIALSVRTPSDHDIAQNNCAMRNDVPSLTLGVMRTPKNKHAISSKKRTRRIAIENSSPNASRARFNDTLQKRAAARKIQESAARADGDVLTSPSQTVNQTYSGTEPSEVDDRENTENRTGIFKERRPPLTSAVLTNGARVITIGISAITMEWFNIMRRCTERSLGAMHLLLQCRTPAELFTAQSNLLFGNLNDAFEGANKLLRQAGNNWENNEIAEDGDKAGS